jgi:ABC-type proline/glycine betaine transport system permease subunit
MLLAGALPAAALALLIEGGLAPAAAALAN